MDLGDEHVNQIWLWNFVVSDRVGMGCEMEGASFMIGYDSYDGVVEPTEPVDCDSHMFFLHFHLPDHQDPR